MLRKNLLAVIPILALLFSPFFPKYAYFPQGLSICAIVLLIYSLLLKKNDRHYLKINFADIGISLLFLATFFSFVKEITEIGWIPSEFKYSIFSLYFTVYLFFRVNPITEQNQKKISSIAFILLTFFFLFVFYHFSSKSFDQLTVVLNYENSFGNVSQISMYCCFYLLLVLVAKSELKILGYLSIAMCGCLAFMLQSKLLFIVLGLGVVNLLLNKINYKNKLVFVSVLGIAAFIIILFFTPSSFQGRLNNFAISISNYDWFQFMGLGLGNFENYINDVFFHDLAVNNIGKIDRIAFNDYLQIFIELGYVGILGLIFISIYLLKNQRLFLGLALCLIALIMFPLQYFESGVIWFLLVVILKDQQGDSFFRLYSSSLKTPLLIISISTFMLISYQAFINYKWYEADNYSNKEKRIESLRQVFKYHSDNDIFHLKFAKEIMSINQKEKALNLLVNAYDLNKSYNTSIYLADTYYKLNKKTKAEDFYKAAIKLNPSKLYPVYRLIYIYYSQKNKTKVNLLYEKVNKFRDSNNSQVQIMLKELDGLMEK